jgi:ATP-dependent Clp protease ATP-binding subunit ClpA/post-segregation antitoxin (ccd killing protein)
MPKINVYLPDELADAVKESGVPVSAICQRALEQSVRRVTAIRETVLSDLEVSDPTAQLSRFTKRAATVVKLAIEQARADGSATVGTQHLLHGILAEGGNMALMVLTAIEVDPKQLAGDLAAAARSAGETDQANRFDGPAANAIELAVTEAISLGHNYVGCEHLLLGLVSEPDGLGGHLLRTRGVELRLARRATAAALAGLVHVKSQTAGNPDPAQLVAEVVRRELEPLTRRLDRLEANAGLT